LRKLNVNAPSVTATNPLPGARARVKRSAVSNAGLKDETIKRLFELYGSRADELIQLAAPDEPLREPLSPPAPDLSASCIRRAPSFFAVMAFLRSI
jgi:glycerol-3-phosphate dehydrogenase